MGRGTTHLFRKLRRRCGRHAVDRMRAAYRRGVTRGYEQGLLAGRDEARVALHNLSVGPVGAVSTYLASIAEELPTEQRQKVASVAGYLRALRARQGMYIEGRPRNVQSVVEQGYWASKVIDGDDRLDGLEIELSTRSGRVVPPPLTATEANALDQIVSEAIRNARGHARGRIRVGLDAIEDGGRTYCQLSVRDGGPTVRSRAGTGIGLRSIMGYAQRYGWKAHLEIGSMESPSLFTLRIPTDSDSTPGTGES